MREELSLAPGTDFSVYKEYTAVIEIPGVERGVGASWFDQIAGNHQGKRQKDYKGYAKGKQVRKVGFQKGKKRIDSSYSNRIVINRGA